MQQPVRMSVRCRECLHHCWARLSTEVVAAWGLSTGVRAAWLAKDTAAFGARRWGARVSWTQVVQQQQVQPQWQHRKPPLW